MNFLLLIKKKTFFLKVMNNMSFKDYFWLMLNFFKMA